MTIQASAGIGDSVTTLEAQSILDNAIIVFSSDHSDSIDLATSIVDLRDDKVALLKMACVFLT